jgi:hypothetical protein
MNNTEGILPCLGCAAFWALMLPLIVQSLRLRWRALKELDDLRSPDIKARNKAQENSRADKALRFSLSLHFIGVAVIVVLVVLGILNIWIIPEWASFLGLILFAGWVINGLVMGILAAVVFMKSPK